jgi:hypothetical protein
MYHSSYQERRGETPVADNRSYFRQKGLEYIHTYNIYIHTDRHILQDALKRQCDAMAKTRVCGLQLLVHVVLSYECLKSDAIK